jgi:hypothetical protein
MKTTTATAPVTGLPRLGGLALLAFLLLGAGAGAAPAAGPALTAAAPAAPAVLAEGGFSVKGFLSGLGSRARVVQLCVVTMCLALFILMRKFTAGGGW